MSKPFSRQIDPAALYESQAHREALARLHLMVESHYLGLLSGEVGSGKSLLIRRLFQSLDPMRYLPIYISKGNLMPRDFYGELLRCVGEVPPFSLAKAKRLWSQTLEARQEQADKVLVVAVDEAMLGELRSVVNHQMDSCSIFPLILVGQPELRRTLRLKKYEAIAQRIPLQYHLGVLNSEETAHYIRHQMKTFGVIVPVFSESAMALVHAASQGIPRIINQICSQALYDASQRGHEVIEEAHIARVLADFDRQRGVAG